MKLWVSTSSVSLKIQLAILAPIPVLIHPTCFCSNVSQSIILRTDTHLLANLKWILFKRTDL